MKMKKSLKKSPLVIGLVLAGLSVSAWAQNQPSTSQANSSHISTSQSASNWSQLYRSYNWYVAPNVGYVWPDSNRQTKDSANIGLSVGKWLNPNNTLDLEFNHNNADFKNSSARAGKQWETSSLMLTARHYWGQPSSHTRWYGLLGLGAIRDAAVSSVVHSPSWSPAAKAGFGIEHDWTPRVAWRAEVAYRYDHDSGSSNHAPSLPNENHYGDVMATVGLVIGLGSRPTPPPPVQPTPPVTPPPPSCQNLDSDNDGVNNCDDKCPQSPEGQIVGPDGCPQKVVIDLRGVHFKFDRPKPGEENIAPTLQEPTEESMDILNQTVDTLKRYPQLDVEVDGYTDSIGSSAYNQKLSERRAQAVYQYLIDHGINSDRLLGPKGFGEFDPIAPNDTVAGRAQNRRVELKNEDQNDSRNQDSSSDQF